MRVYQLSRKKEAIFLINHLIAIIADRLRPRKSIKHLTIELSDVFIECIKDRLKDVEIRICCVG